VSPRSARFALAVIAFHALTAVARPQGSTLELRAASNERATIDAGTVITSAFTVKNGGSDSAHVQPALTVPRGWSIVMGNAAFTVAPGATETWLVGVSVPASAPAASYVVRGSLAAAGATVADSIVVRVTERRAIEILSIDVPGWVLAGSRYESRFLVRNRGNVPSAIVLSGSTSRGTHCDAMPSALALEPGASATVTVRVTMGASLDRTTDDVLELTATDKADRSVRVAASTRTTVIGSDGASRFTTVPAMLSVRSIGGASGVSPVALAGAGLLADNKTSVDFLLQAPVANQTPYGFGERDEYRANFKSGAYSLKLGDNLYGFSSLTSSGMMGTGAEFDGSNSVLSAGAYAQRLRWIPGSNSEEGMFLGTAPDSLRQLSATAVERQSDGGPVSVGSLGGHVRLAGAVNVLAEVASSDSNHTPGLAERAGVSGAVQNVSYQVGVLNGNSSFAGLARGTTAEDGTVSARITNQVTLAASGSMRVSNFATLLEGIPAQRFGSANFSASYGGIATLEYGWLARHDDGVTSAVDGTQQGLRATTSLPLGPASFSVSYERGIVDPADGSSSRPYDVVSLSAQTKLGNAGTISLFGSHDDGNTLTGGTSGVANAGASIDVRLPFSLELALSTSAQRATLGVFDGSGAWFSQSDARLDYHFQGGQTLSLRERVWQNPLLQGSPDARAVYLEFRAPIHLPVGPARGTGRAEGIIVDAGTGRPVVGVLVRLADQAAVTDKNGRVAFTGLEPARQRVSLDATGPAAGAMLVGDAFVDIHEGSRTPARFALQVVRGGSVRALVRRLAPALGTLAANKDSMVTVSMEPNVLVALQSARDTIYQSSDEHGRVDFGTVAPGMWTLVVMPGNLPDHHTFETDRMEIKVQPGERRDVELRLIPQRRAVTFIGNDSPIQAKPLP
jgi:NPCBM-associated, NEW3 domain of alpha-galactosidase